MGIHLACKWLALSILAFTNHSRTGVASEIATEKAKNSVESSLLVKDKLWSTETQKSETRSSCLTAASHLESLRVYTVVGSSHDMVLHKLPNSESAQSDELPEMQVSLDSDMEASEEAQSQSKRQETKAASKATRSAGETGDHGDRGPGHQCRQAAMGCVDTPISSLSTKQLHGRRERFAPTTSAPTASSCTGAGFQTGAYGGGAKDHEIPTGTSGDEHRNVPSTTGDADQVRADPSECCAGEDTFARASEQIGQGFEAAHLFGWEDWSSRHGMGQIYANNNGKGDETCEVVYGMQRGNADCIPQEGTGTSADQAGDKGCFGFFAGKSGRCCHSSRHAKHRCSDPSSSTSTGGSNSGGIFHGWIRRSADSVRRRDGRGTGERPGFKPAQRGQAAWTQEVASLQGVAFTGQSCKSTPEVQVSSENFDADAEPFPRVHSLREECVHSSSDHVVVPTSVPPESHNGSRNACPQVSMQVDSDYEVDRIDDILHEFRNISDSLVRQIAVPRSWDGKLHTQGS